MLFRSKQAAMEYDRKRLELGPPQSGRRSKLNFARAAWADTLYPLDGEKESDRNEGDEADGNEDEDEDKDEEEDDKEEEDEEDETARYVGVCQSRSGRFEAKITFNGKTMYLGMFDIAMQAAMEFDRKRLELGPPRSGWCSKLNFARAAWADKIGRAHV